MTPAPPVPLLQVEGLVRHFPGRRGAGPVRAVDGVSLEVAEGETLGLVGESGCGKTTLARALLRLLEPQAGRVLWRGRDLLALGAKELRAVRRELQVVFQDPAGTLDPRLSVEESVAEPLAVHALARGAERGARVRELLRRTGLPEDRAQRLPHELSGGERQRVGLARALATGPRLLVADEPLASLDVSVQAQIVNLLCELQEQNGLAILLVSHDLHVVERVADRVAVMYAGRLVEAGPAAEVFSRPLHPYTRALREAAPVPDPGRARGRLVLAGEAPDLAALPGGCAFHPRCPLADDRCRAQAPEPVAAGREHRAACHRAGQAGEEGAPIAVSR